jgi:hypothetical protein
MSASGDMNFFIAAEAALARVAGLRQSERTELVDNLNEVSPRGAAGPYALRRLERQRPDLYAKVLTGDVSPHRAW